MFRKGMRWRKKRSWLGLGLTGLGILVLALLMPGWFWPVLLGFGLIAIGLFIYAR